VVVRYGLPRHIMCTYWLPGRLPGLAREPLPLVRPRHLIWNRPSAGRNVSQPTTRTCRRAARYRGPDPAAAHANRESQHILGAVHVELPRRAGRRRREFVCHPQQIPCLGVQQRRLAEDRVAERRNRLVDAGVEVVGRGGVAALGMRAVCREAGLSQKFFYESFPNIEALLHAVYASALSRMEKAVAPAMSSDDLHGVFDAAARLMEADPRICRILLVEPVADLGLRRHVREANRTLS